MSSQNEFPFFAKVISASIAGMIGVSACFPLDLVKTRLQNQTLGPNGEKKYNSIADCFKKVYRAGGLAGMYRGYGVTVTLMTPEKIVKFASNDYFRHHLTKPDGSLSIYRQTLAGGLTGLVQLLISTPLELMKINMQISSKSENEREKRTARSIFRERGFFGIYKGIAPTAARDVVFNMIYFPLFASLNNLGPKRPDGTTAPWCSLLSGLTAGAVSAISGTPMDVIKTRIQASNSKCHSIITCGKNILRHEGFTTFFNGGLCRVMVIAPLFAIVQSFYFLGIGEAVVAYFKPVKELKKS